MGLLIKACLVDIPLLKFLHVPFHVEARVKKTLGHYCFIGARNLHRARRKIKI